MIREGLKKMANGNGTLVLKIFTGAATTLAAAGIIGSIVLYEDVRSLSVAVTANAQELERRGPKVEKIPTVEQKVDALEKKVDDNQKRNDKAHEKLGNKQDQILNEIRKIGTGR